MRCCKCLKNLKSSDKQQYGLHETCFLSWFDLEKREDFSSLVVKSIVRESPGTQEFSRINSSFFQGKFKKYAADLGGQAYILKVQEKEYPDLPATEYVCNQIAKSLRLNVPDFYFIRFYGIDTFVTRNFVRTLHKENLIHVYRFVLREEEFDCQTLIKVIEQQTGCLQDVERFVELCLFDALIGNHDRHGRNLAIWERKGRKVLAPFYDNPSYLGIEQKEFLAAQHSPRGKIATSQTTSPSMQDYAREFKDMGYFEILKKFYQKVRSSQIAQLIEKSFILKSRKQSLQRLIDQRYKELCGVIN